MFLNSIKPLSEEERRADLRYGSYLVVSVMVVPVIALTAGFVYGHVVFGLLAAVLSSGLGIAVGIGKRRRIIEDFFRVRDVERRVEMCEMRDAWELEEALRMNSVAFVAARDASWLCFTYNWLANRAALKDEEKLRTYWLSGQLLVASLESDIVPNRDFLLVPGTEFTVTPKGEERFERELRFVGGVWLKDLVRMVRESGESEMATMYQEPATDYLANKSQRL